MGSFAYICVAMRHALDTHIRFKYRNIPHSTTGKSPTELLFGRKVRTHFDHLHPDEAKAVEEQQLKQKVYHDRHAKDRQVNVGDPVYMTNFSSGPCWLPGVVVNKSGPVSFIVKMLMIVL